MVFSVTGLPSGIDANYTWSFKPSNKHKNRDGAFVETLVDEGSEASAKFHGVNCYWMITLTATLNDGSGESYTRSSEAISKYVRREIRDLSSTDREKYFSALEVIYNHTQEEGTAIYGDDFTSYTELVAGHDSSLYGYHTQNAFLTSHPAFQLQVRPRPAGHHPSN